MKIDYMKNVKTKRKPKKSNVPSWADMQEALRIDMKQWSLIDVTKE